MDRLLRLNPRKSSIGTAAASTATTTGGTAAVKWKPSPLSSRLLKLMIVCIVITTLTIVIILVYGAVTAPKKFDTEETTENDIPLMFGLGVPATAAFGALLWSMAPTDYFSPVQEALDFDQDKKKNKENEGKKETKVNNKDKTAAARRKRVAAARRRRQAAIRHNRLARAKRIKRTRLRGSVRRVGRATRFLRGIGGRIFGPVMMLV